LCHIHAFRVYRARHFTCYDQFLCMAFAQLTYRHSLRDIETCLNSLKAKLYSNSRSCISGRNSLDNRQGSS